MDEKELEVADKEQLKSMKQFLYNLCEYVVKQTQNSHTRLRLVEGQLSGDGFILKSIQYKNGNKDFVLSEYKEGKEYSLNSAKDLKPFYDLFVNKVF